MGQSIRIIWLISGMIQRLWIYLEMISISSITMIVAPPKKLASRRERAQTCITLSKNLCFNLAKRNFRAVNFYLSTDNQLTGKFGISVLSRFWKVWIECFMLLVWWSFWSVDSQATFQLQKVFYRKFWRTFVGFYSLFSISWTQLFNFLKNTGKKRSFIQQIQ